MGPVVAFYRPELAPELAKYANATDVAMRLIYDIERPRTKVMSRGLDAEPRLRKAYLDAYGGVLEEHRRPWIVQHQSAPWATCSPDDVRVDSSIHYEPGGFRYVQHEPSDPAERRRLLSQFIATRHLVEYKSTSIFARSKWGEPETDEVVPLYGLQTQWCMEILDLPLAHLFVGFGRDITDEHGEAQFLYEQTARYVIPRDRELAAMALEYCSRFQSEFIECRKLPPLAPINNKRAYSQLLKGTHPCQTQAAPSQS